MGQQGKKIDHRPDTPCQVENEMKDLVPPGPYHPAGWACSNGCKIPMEIVTADGSKKNKSYQATRRGSPQQQMTGLPDHQDSAQGNVKAAEYKKVYYFSQHFGVSDSKKLVMEQRYDDRGSQGVTGYSIAVDCRKFEEDCVILRVILIQVSGIR
jgi:hypothetical protein